VAVEALVGFGLGFSVVAMFGRFRASIFAKAADIGAAVAENEDCGTVNPAAIAANVGVHVGDVGANGADLLETHVLSIIAAATIASGDMAMIALPFWLAGAGVIASAIAFFFVKAEDGASKDGILYALYKGKMISSVLFVALSAIIVSIFFDNLGKGWAILCCIIIGQVFGMFVSQLTEIFTSNSFLVKSIRDTDTIGPAVLIMRAVAFGLFSCIGPAVFIVVSLLATIYLSGAYGVAIAAVAMLSNVALHLATDTCVAITSNAATIAGMTGTERAYEATAILESANLTAASAGKGFAVASSVLTSVSVLTALKVTAGLASVDTNAPTVLAGLLVGVWFPFFFSALILFSVQEAAGSMIIETRRQLEGIAEVSGSSSVNVAAKSSLQEMIIPALYASMAPLITGIVFGPLALAGMLTGAIATSMMINMTLSNTVSVINSVKNYTEIDGEGKIAQTYKTGTLIDSLGAAFSAVGPALNTLIKLMSIISLVMGPFMTNWAEWSYWYFGIIPVAIALTGTALYYLFIWKDDEEVTVAAPEA
jgi:K(+)-stimulated pyrophosphate-energized sodium pump